MNNPRTIRELVADHNRRGKPQLTRDQRIQAVLHIARRTIDPATRLHKAADGTCTITIPPEAP